MMETPTHGTLFIPKWFNDDFIAFHLRSYFDDQTLEIVRFELRPATAKGDNFASSMYRVNVEFVRRANSSDATNLSLTVKVPVSDVTALAAISANNLYKKEIEFYSQIAPKIKATLTRLNETKQLIADCYGACSANDALLLEDLTIKSYSMSSIHRGFNFDEAKIVLEKAAAFHAVNAVLQLEQPNIFENFKYGLMSRHTNVYDTFYLTQFDAMTEAISTWPDASLYVPKLRRLRNSLLEKGLNTFDPNPKHFNTLIHGDLWINNIMIKNEKDRPDCGSFDKAEQPIENMIFVDFQYSCWTSPAVELHFFMNTSLQESLRPTRFDELIAYYHGHLETNLKRLKYKKPIPNLVEFKQQYRDKSFYGFIVSCMVQPLLLNKNTENANCQTFISDDENSLNFKRKIFSSTIAQANLRKLIPIYDQMGAFN